MYLVNICDVTPGQTLAKPVTNADGAILCPVGFRLTESAVARLQNAGIEAVVVEGGVPSRRSIEARLEELETRFQGVNDAIMLQLKAAIQNRLNLMRLTSGGSA